MHQHHHPRLSKTGRSTNGCWTCRLRRKKCDERRPLCGECAALRLTCHYNEEKPEWMDGGTQQEEMAEQFKRAVRERGFRRRTERSDDVSGGNLDCAAANVIPDSDRTDTSPGAAYEDENTPTAPPRQESGCTLAGKSAGNKFAFERSDTILFTFYLDHVLHFLFPFYQPPILEGGKSWVLEMILSSPVIRKATLCQSSYFFFLAQGTAQGDAAWQTILSQTGEAFEVLSQALQILQDSSIKEHLHGSVRILASITQVQRFEIATSSFNNSRSHLNAAITLFEQILSSATNTRIPDARSCFKAVMEQLEPSSWGLPAQSVAIPSAEQAAFHFSTSLLILDDIVASTSFQEEPRLYNYHCSLLKQRDDAPPLIDLETVVGCQNWVLLGIGEIAMLDAWKQGCKGVESLDIMELVNRATSIKATLLEELARLNFSPPPSPTSADSLLDIFISDHNQQTRALTGQSVLNTRVWAHAALLYLNVVVSGWQPANVEVRHHVSQILEMATHSVSPRTWLRTMIWPFCVAGCLAESAQETRFRCILENLQPPSIFGTARKALEIIENVWRNRSTVDTATRDLAACFRSQGGLVLLI